MKPIDYVRFICNQMPRRAIAKEEQIEIRHELFDMVRDGMTTNDIRFVVHVKYGALFKGNCIEY